MAILLLSMVFIGFIIGCAVIGGIIDYFTKQRLRKFLSNGTKQ